LFFSKSDQAKYVVPILTTYRENDKLWGSNHPTDNKWLMNEMDLLIDLHKEGQRQGPGSDKDTLRALSFVDFEHDQPLKVADLGCGTGAQTLVLAESLNAHITAVDVFPDFLQKLNTNAEKRSVADKISTLQQSMENLPFGNQEMDLIWSEGAIYIMGFEKGVKKWKQYLKPGGYMALSEITWTTQTRPKEIEEHWNQEYPEISTASKKIKILEENGFSPVGYFYIPPSSWIENYYQPLEARVPAFLERHGHSKVALDIVAAERDEYQKYGKYQNYLSYGFYIARKLS
jgi:ubiquinone/menaquinone biosynthesis C-methylase UbiE